MDAYGDPHCIGRAGLDCHRPHRYASRHELVALLVQEAFTRDPHGGDLYVFRGNVASCSSVALCQESERGRFLWPSSADGVVTITPAHLAAC